jgi:hypothetical protein
MVSLEGQIVPKRSPFQYLGSMLQSNGDIHIDGCHKIKTKFLEANHNYRSDTKNFKKGVAVHTPRPHLPTGKNTKAELEALVPNTDGKGFVAYRETHQWTHIPCLWKLPYFEDLEQG